MCCVLCPLPLRGRRERIFSFVLCLSSRLAAGGVLFILCKLEFNCQKRVFVLSFIQQFARKAGEGGTSPEEICCRRQCRAHAIAFLTSSLLIVVAVRRYAIALHANRGVGKGYHERAIACGAACAAMRSRLREQRVSAPDVASAMHTHAHARGGG